MMTVTTQIPEMTMSGKALIFMLVLSNLTVLLALANAKEQIKSYEAVIKRWSN